MIITPQQNNDFRASGTALTSHHLLVATLAGVMVMAQGIASACNGTTQGLDAKPFQINSAPRVKTVSMEIGNGSLYSVMQAIQTHGGALVKLPQDLACDLVSRSVRSGTWKDAVGHLLANYNYSAVWDKNGYPLQVTVYNRNQNADGLIAPSLLASVQSSDELLSYEPAPQNLPDKYQGLNPGSVSPVTMPADRMRHMAIGDKMSLSLPTGQFEVVHDNRFQNENGDLTWSGYLNNAGKQYRVTVTISRSGTQGQMTTPDGVYNLDFEGGRTWLVNAGPSEQESPDFLAKASDESFP